MQKNHNTTLTKRAVFVVFIACLATLTLSYALFVQSRYNLKHQTVSVKQKPFSIDTDYQIGNATIRISNIRLEPGQAPFIAPTGKQYVILDVVVINRSDAPINVLPSSDMYVKDSNGSIAYLTPYVTPSPFRAGELLPGDKIKGDVSFLVPEGTLVLYVDAVWSGGVVPILLR